MTTTPVSRTAKATCDAGTVVEPAVTARRSAVFSSVLATAVAVGLAATASAQTYRVVPIQLPPDVHWAAVSDVNNRLEVVGLALRASGEPRYFAWSSASGFRDLPFAGQTALWIDDAGVIYGERATAAGLQLTRYVAGVFHDVPQPPGDVLGFVHMVTNNGIVLFSGDRTTWALVGTTFYDVNALTGANIFAVNEQGILGGAKDLRSYIRTLDGREFEPVSDLMSSVTRIGPSGHYVVHPRFFGAPDGRVWALEESATYNFIAINAAGMLIGSQTDSNGIRPLLYRDGEKIDIQRLIDVPSWRVGTLDAINDAGVIVARGTTGLALLVPQPEAPTAVRFYVDGHIVRLEWDRLPSALEYFIQAGSSPNAFDVYNGSVGPALTASGVLPTGRYYVRIRARLVNGELTPFSSEAVIDVGALPVAPTVPTGVTASVVGRTAAVQWQASLGATDYIVEAGRSPGASDFFVGSVGYHIAVEAPVPPGRYFVRIRARNAAGTSLPSAEVTFDVF